MKKFLLTLAAVAACIGCLQTRAAVSVGLTNGIQTFPATPVPPATDWSTLSITGTAGDITDVAGLDSAAQALSASSIITPLGTSTTIPPSANALARLNTGTGLYLQTRPVDACKMVVLMATLRNDSGVAMTSLRISYDLGYTNTPSGAALAEEVAGHRAYYSMDGLPNSWVLIPSLTTGSPGHLTASLSIPSWAPSATMYLLWLDDNGSGAQTGVVGTTPGEGTYTIDNFAIGSGEPISFGIAGTGTLTFDTYPWEAQWTTVPVPGAAGDLLDATAIATAVQAFPASAVNVILGSSPTVPPSANALGRWNTANHDLQTRTTGGRASVLMATLRNDSGSSQSSIKVSYDLIEDVEPANTIGEEVHAHQAFYNKTGNAGDWVLIPEFSNGAPGALGVAAPLSATLNLGSWAAGDRLYIIWIDDNGSGGTTVGTPPLEGIYRIDNFKAETTTAGVAITSPAEGASFVQGTPITISAAVVMPGNITGVEFFQNGNSLGVLTAPPFSVIYNGATLGAHALTVTAHDDQANNVTSPTVNITVVPNNPPTVTLTTVPAGPVLVGLNIVNTAAASDSDGSVTQVVFYVDGVLRFTDATSPYTFEYCDPTAGTHIISAVASDNAGYLGTNSHTLVVTNPPDTTILVANGGIWKYLDDGSDQGTAWRAPTFVDTAWNSGPAELGYGDVDNNRPPITTVGFGPNAATKYVTTYFRHKFNVGNPADYTNLIVRLLRDDGGVVYINGTEVFRSHMTNAAFTTYTTLAGLAAAGPAAPDDGTIYQETNATPSVLVSGENTVAVEIHQDALNSSDISFDLMLWAQGAAGPTLHIVLNPNGSVTLSVDAGVSGTLISTTDISTPRASWTNEGAIDNANPRTIAQGSLVAKKFYALSIP
jgi:hypothetical protein